MTFDTLWEKYEFAGVQARIEKATRADVERALGRVRSGLSLDDFSALLSPSAVPYLETMAQLAHQQTIERFGRTMQLYIPLYLSNVCSNLCTYCGFSAQNPIPRMTLTDEQIVANAQVINGYGFEHVLLLTGESPKVGVAYLKHALRLLRPYFSSLSLEVQPLSTDDYATLVAEGVNAVMVYQETYDPEAYARHHLRGPKADIRYRLNTADRLSVAGVKKVGLGALYGLSQWRADAWFVGLHLRYLEKHHWRTRANISFPRLRPHEGREIPMQLPFSERDLVHVLCAFRLLSQEVELSLSTRESAHFRNHAFRLGVTSMSAGSRTDPGGYTNRDHVLEQFAVDDTRSPAEVARFLRRAGYEPVWKDWDSTYDGYKSCKLGLVNEETAI
jgi:2-iminoacetate synthase